MKACVFTLGCKQNEAESASIMQGLQERGFEVSGELGYADLYLLNTCAVTAEAEKKSRQAVARMRKFNKSAPVVVFGCAAQNNAETFSGREGVTFVSGAMAKSKVLGLVDSLMRGERGGVCVEPDEREFCEMPFPKRTKTRALLRVQDGCNNFCSYCLIPYLRGRTRSRKMESVLEEAMRCDAKEIVLTGIDLSSYRDGENTLGDLLVALKDVPARIRLGSLEEGIVTDDFLSKMKKAENVCPHFHLSLQSGSTSVLRAMNRHYSREQYLAACRKIYDYFPDAAITTDIIVGFPTETEEDFYESLSIIEEVGFASIHAFPFSARRGTVAAKLPDLSPAVKKQRMARILKAVKETERAYLARFLNRRAEALFESDGGYTENYIRVFAENANEGSMYEVVLESIVDGGMYARIIKEI